MRTVYRLHRVAVNPTRIRTHSPTLQRISIASGLMCRFARVARQTHRRTSSKSVLSVRCINERDDVRRQTTTTHTHTRTQSNHCECVRAEPDCRVPTIHTHVQTDRRKKNASMFVASEHATETPQLAATHNACLCSSSSTTHSGWMMQSFHRNVREM